MLEEKKIPNDSLNKSNILCVYTNFLIVNKNFGWRMNILIVLDFCLNLN